jgi:tripartite-type tricarboxylate transporter receptor subunit TctC
VSSNDPDRHSMKTNNPERWRLLRAGCSALAFALLVGTATAQPYPSRSVRLIVPAGAGGGVDTVARLVAQPLGEALGQPVIADNRPGAGTMLASELLAKSPPDGYTLLMVTNSHAIS